MKLFGKEIDLNNTQGVVTGLGLGLLCCATGFAVGKTYGKLSTYEAILLSATNASKNEQ